MKIFLNSTFEDLIDHRAKAAQAVKRLGQHGIRMEVFGARPGEAAAICLDEIHSYEAFVGIYAHRYGYIPGGSETTVTFENRRFAYDAALYHLEHIARHHSGEGHCRNRRRDPHHFDAKAGTR